MEIIKFKEHKKQVLDEKKKIADFAKKLVVGKEYAQYVYKQHPLMIKKASHKSYRLLGFISKDSENFSYGIAITVCGKQKMIIPVYLQIEKDRSCFNYEYIFLFNKNVSANLVPFLKEKKYSLVFDTKWQVIVKFSSKENAINFLSEDLDYSILKKKCLQEFEVRDALNSKNNDFFTEGMSFLMCE